MLRKIKTRNKIIYSVLVLFIFSMFRESAGAEINPEKNISADPSIADSLMKVGFSEIIDQTRWNVVTIIDKLIDINTSILDLIKQEIKSERSLIDIEELKDLIEKGRNKNSSSSLSTYTRESLSYIDEANNQLNSILNDLKSKLEENSETRRLMGIINIVLKIQNKLANEEFENEKLSKYLQILRNKIVEEIIRRYLKILFMKTDSEKINAKISGPGIEIDFVKEITKSDITNYDYTGLKDLSDYMGINKEIISNMKINNKINNIEGIKNDIDVINKLNSLCKTLYGFIDELTSHHEDNFYPYNDTTKIVAWPNPDKKDYEDLGLPKTENLSIDGTYNIKIKNTGRQDSMYLKTASYRIETRMKRPSLTLE